MSKPIYQPTGHPSEFPSDSNNHLGIDNITTTILIVGFVLFWCYVFYRMKKIKPKKMGHTMLSIKLRMDIIKMKDIIYRVGGHPSSETREEIVGLINNICFHKVTDRTTPEDIDNGVFRYGVQPKTVKEEVIVKFTKNY
jgi:hypothetical protein